MDFQNLVKKICSDYCVVGVVGGDACVASFEVLGKDGVWRDWPAYIRFTKDESACTAHALRRPIDPKAKRGEFELVEIDGYYVAEQRSMRNAERKDVPEKAWEIWENYVKQRAQRKK